LVVVVAVVELYAGVESIACSYIVEGSCPGMFIIQPLRAYALERLVVQLLRAYALGCFNHPKLLRAHALECLVIQTRKMVPHAYCISCCRWRIVVVVVVGCRRCVIA